MCVGVCVAERERERERERWREREREREREESTSDLPVTLTLTLTLAGGPQGRQSPSAPGRPQRRPGRTGAQHLSAPRLRCTALYLSIPLGSILLALYLSLSLVPVSPALLLFCRPCHTFLRCILSSSFSFSYFYSSPSLLILSPLSRCPARRLSTLRPWINLRALLVGPACPLLPLAPARPRHLTQTLRYYLIATI